MPSVVNSVCTHTPFTLHATFIFIVQFKDIQFAYEVLSDPEKRERYDHFGMAGVTDDAAGPSEYIDLCGGCVHVLSN